MIDICPHGLLRIECDLCREISIKRPSNMINKDTSDWDLEVPYHHQNLNFEDNLSQKIKPIHILENRIKKISRSPIFSNDTKTLFEQRNEFLKRTLPAQKELDKSSEIIDIKKGFLKKKSVKNF